MNPEYDELLVLAETLGEVKSKTEKLEAEFSTQARPLEAATNALSAALSGIKALQFHVLDNNLGQLSARVEEMRKAVDEQVGVIALELKKADETNAAKAGQEAEALRSQISALQAQLGTLGEQFAAQLERVEFSAKEEAKKLQLIPGPAGAAGASLNPRGTFIDGETYNRLDVVSWLGSSYIAAVDGVTEKPSKNSNQWQVLASRGSGGSGGAGDFGSLAGVAQINQGGTGQTTRAAGLNALLPDQAGATQYMLLTDGAGTVSWGAQPVAGLPSQTSNGGKLLTTDGTNASWSSTLTAALTISATTASTSTSSGALVVSGGVGVAGASTFGDTVTVNTAGGMLRVVNSNSLQPRGLVSDNVGNFENSGTVHLRKARGTESAKTAVLAGDSIGNVSFSGWDGTAYQLHEGIFQVRAAENFGTGHYGTYMQWQLIKANTGYTVYEAMRLTDSGNLLLGFGDNPTEGTGRLQLAAGAAGRASGLGFANDTWLYRSGANTLTFDTSGNAAVLNVRENATLTAAIGTVTGDLYLQTQQAGKKVYIKTGNAATAATFDQNQKAEFAATIKTAAPAGGTAAEWKLGSVATVSPTSPNRTIEVDIGGTIYYIHAKTTNN